MILLRKLLYKRIFLVLATIVCGVLSIAVSLYWNLHLSKIINIVSVGKMVSTNSIVVAIVIMLVNAAVAYGLGVVSGFTCETLTHDLRMGYARYISSKPVQELEQLNVGEQLSKLQNEISDVSEYLRSNLVKMLYDAICFIATFSWLLFLNPTLTILPNIPVVAIMIYVVYSSKIISIASEKSQQAKTQMNGYTDTLITLFPIIRIYSASKLILNGHDKALLKWGKSSTKEERTRAGLMSISAILTAFPLLLLFLVGGILVINGEVTIGLLYIFINLSGNISGVMMNMPGFVAAFRRFSVNMKRLEPCVLLDDSDIHIGNLQGGKECD